MSTAILCELKKLLHNAAFCLFGALLLAAGAFYPFVRALAPDANGVALMDRQAVPAAYADVSPQQAAADIEAGGFAFEPFGEDTYQIRAVPVVLGEPQARAPFVEMLDRLRELLTEEDRSY